MAFKLIPDEVAGFIKATSAFGGDHFPEYSQYFTDDASREFDRWLETQPCVSGKTLYRGYCFDRYYWEDGGLYEPGDILTEDNFTQSIELPGFTESQLRAVGYMSEFGEGLEVYDRQKVLFEVRTNGKHFVDLSRLTFYPSETEHRCKRGTRVKVVSVKRTSFIHIICEE